MARIDYSDEQINDFLDVAQEVGIGKAIRQLGYPASWSTAHRWAELRGVKVMIDEVKAKAKAFHDWYETEDMLLVAQEGILRVHDELVNNDKLSSDDQKKLSEAFTKYSNQWLVLQGKANNVTESRQGDGMDAGIIDLLNAERAKNHLRDKENVTEE